MAHTSNSQFTEAPLSVNGGAQQITPADSTEPDDTNRPRLMRLGDLLSSWERDANSAHRAFTDGSLRGPITGFKKLDREIGGALCPGVHILHGQPGTGKTAFALQIAANCGFPALFITCEMAPLELLRRHTARVTGTFLGRLKSGELTPAVSLALAQRAALSAPRLTLIDATQAAATARYICECAEIARGDSPHLLIVLDSVHSWAEGLGLGVPEYEALNAAVAALRKMASMLGCPVLAVCERNRETMKTGGLSAGAGTRKIEYGAETVFDLGRDHETRGPAEARIPLQLKLAKNRHGSAGVPIDLEFEGALQRFSEST